MFRQTQVQAHIVHLIRASLNSASRKERKTLATDLKPVDRAVNAEAATVALQKFRVRWPKHQVVADV